MTQKVRVWSKSDINYPVFFRSLGYMRKGSLEVTFFPSVCMSVCEFCEIQLWVTSYDYLWAGSGPEVDRKWTGIGMRGIYTVRLISSYKKGCVFFLISNQPKVLLSYEIKTTTQKIGYLHSAASCYIRFPILDQYYHNFTS